MKVITTNLLNRFWKNGVLKKLELKVDTAKIINNFTTTVAGNVADARALKTLRDLITGLQNKTDELNGKTNTISNNIECIVTVDENSGVHFNRDFTHIDLGNRYGVANKTSYFFVEENQHHLWKSLPPGLNPALPFIGIRTVYHRAKEHSLVEIKEMFPIEGRLWYKFYNVGTWGSWKVHEPKDADALYPQVPSV